MQKINAIGNVTAAVLLTEVFGDEKTAPFQIRILRTKGEDPADQWTWSTQLSLENREVQAHFESLIMSSLQVTNEELPATLVITAYTTNVGYEPRFQLTNCTFLKRGMRRLRKSFSHTMARWDMARRSVACAWEMGGLQVQTEIKAIQLSQCDSPGLVHRLQVRVRTIDSWRGVLAIIKAQKETAWVVFDFDHQLTQSGFRFAVQQKLETCLRDLVRKGMAECFAAHLQELLGEVPDKLLQALRKAGIQHDRFEDAGLPVQVDPNLPELMAIMQEYLQHRKDLEKPCVPITFSVYKSGELIVERTLSDKVIKIGREQGEEHIRIEDESVPRIHSVIEQYCGAISLIDLGAGLPTFVNGEPLTGKGYLHSGDEIGVGDTFRIKVAFQEAQSDTI